MGMPMARNLGDAGHAVRAWNRDHERAAPLYLHGVKVCESPAEAADGAEVLITMVSDAAAAIDCASAALTALAPGAIWAQMSTIGLEGVALCVDLAAEAGVTLVDAPVLGSRDQAERGELVVLAAGPEAALDICEGIFGGVGRLMLRFREVGDGTRAKLVANNWLLGVNAVLAESIELAEALRIDPRAFLAAIDGGPSDAPYAQVKGPAMIADDFSNVSFKLALAAKDAGLILAEAEHRDLELPHLRATAWRLDEAARAGSGDLDLSAVKRAGRDSAAARRRSSSTVSRA